MQRREILQPLWEILQGICCKTEDCARSQRGQTGAPQAEGIRKACCVSGVMAQNLCRDNGNMMEEQPPAWWRPLMKPESVKDQIPLKFIILVKEGT